MLCNSNRADGAEAPSVRAGRFTWEVAKNLHTPYDTLSILAGDDKRYVRDAARRTVMRQRYPLRCV